MNKRQIRTLIIYIILVILYILFGICNHYFGG